MAKRKRRFHKIVIHPNRYLMWALASMLIVAAGLVSYIYIDNINFDTQLGSDSDINFWHTYKDANLTLRYPGDWLIDVSPSYTGFGPKDEDKFLIYSYSPPNDPAYDSYSKLANVKSVTIGDIPGIRIPDDKKTGQKIAFVKTSKRLYEFRGSSSEFDAILRSVIFIKK